MSHSEENPKEFQDQPTLLPARPNQPADTPKSTSQDQTIDFRSLTENTPAPSSRSSPPKSVAFDHPTLPPLNGSRTDQSQSVHSENLPASISKLSFSSMQEMLPRQFGDYVLIAEIARGGMGVVYKAKQERLNRIVAVKMILSGQLAGKEDVLRFYAEAEAAANLNHPGVVPIYEVGQNEGQHFFSMGFVDGPSLATLITEHPVEPNDAAIIAVQTAEAISYAHARGVIHRDLKPANVLLARLEGSSTNSLGTQRCSRYGQPKVTDFGLAKQISSRSELTATGQILGTPGYMPPEQAAGKTDEVGELADVYSLGGVLYAMLTGTAPFQAATPIDTLIQVLEREPTPPRQINSKIPVDLETICLKCLQKDQKRRYQSANELIEDLNRFIDGSPILARPVTSTERLWRWSRKHPAVAALSLFSAALMLVIVIAAPIIAFRQAQLRMAESIAKNDAISVSEQLEVAKDEAEASHYSANISLAYSLWSQGSLARARHLLNQAPQRFRNWEWWFLDRLCSGNAIPIRGNAAQIPEVRFRENGRLLGLTTMATARQWDIGTGFPCDPIKLGAVKCSFDRFANRMVSWTDDEAFTSELPTVLTQRGFFQQGVPIVLCVHALDSSDIAILRKSARRGDAIAEEFLSLEIVNGIVGTTKTVVENLPGSLNPKVAISPKAEQFAYIADGNSVIWGSKSNGWTVQKFDLTNFKATQACFSPATLQTKGLELLTLACNDGVIRNFDLNDPSDSPTLKSQLETTGAEITALTWDSTGRWIAAGSNDRLVSVWQNGEPNSRSIYRGIDANITSLSFSKDSRHIAAGAEFGLKAWKIESGTGENGLGIKRGVSRQDTQTIPISVGPLTEICTSNDQRSCCTVDESNRIYQIDTNTWKYAELPIYSWLRGTYSEAPFSPPKWNSGIPIQLEMSPDGRTLALTISSLVDAPSLDVPIRVKSSVVLWDLVSQIPVRVLGEHDNLVTCMTFSPDGRTLVVGTGLTAESVQIIKQLSRVGSRTEERRNVIRIWDVSTGLSNLELQTRSENYTVMTFSADGDELYCSGDFATIDVWSWQTKKLLRQIKTPAAYTSSQLLFVELPSSISKWLGESSPGKESESDSQTQMHQQPSQAVMPNNAIPLEIQNDNPQTDTHTRLKVSKSQGIQNEARRACVVTSGTDGRIRVYDAVSGILYRTLEGHSNRVTGVISLDKGNRIASCSADGTVRVWDPVFGTELLSLPHDGRMVNSLTWLPSSQSLLSVSNAGQLCIWQAYEDDLPELNNWVDILESNTESGMQWSRVSGQWKITERNLHATTEIVGNFQGVGDLAAARIDLKDHILPDTTLIDFDLTLNDKTALQLLINDKNDDGEVIELTSAPNPFTQRVGISISKRGGQQALREAVTNPALQLATGQSYKVQILRNPNSITVLIDGTPALRATLATTLDCTLSLQGTYGRNGSIVIINNFSIRSSKPAIERRDAWTSISKWAEEELLASRVLNRIEENDSWSFELKRFARQRAAGILFDHRAIYFKINEWLKAETKDLTKLDQMTELSQSMTKLRNRWPDWLMLAFCKEVAGEYQASLEAVRTSIDLCMKRNGHAMPSHWGLVAICNQKMGKFAAARKALVMSNRSRSFASDDETWDRVSAELNILFGDQALANGLSEEEQALLDFVMNNTLDADKLYSKDFTFGLNRNGNHDNPFLTIDRPNWIELANFLDQKGTIGLEDCLVYDFDVDRKGVVNQEGTIDRATLFAIREIRSASSALFNEPRWQSLKIELQLEPNDTGWEIKKQIFSPISAKYSDSIHFFSEQEIEQWDKQLNEKLAVSNSLSTRERRALAEELLYAMREEDAIKVIKELELESKSNAEDFVISSLAGVRIGNATLARKAAEKAIELRPSIAGPKFLERISLAKIGKFEQVNIGKNLIASVPRSWKLISKDSFIGADNMQVGWLIDPPQACVSTLYKIDGSTREQFLAQIKLSNETYKRTVIEERNLAIGGVEAIWIEVQGPGNGGVIDGQGNVATRQVFVLFFLDREILMLSVVSPEESWGPLKVTFSELVDSISLSPSK